MIALVLTVAVFPIAGAALARLWSFPVPPAHVPRFAFFFLLGLGAHGTLLYIAGSIGIPLHPAVFLAIPAIALAVVLLRRRTFDVTPHERSTCATLLFALPLAVLLCSAAVLPARDYDGRVTWLPKARAIALEQSIAGPFFHGQRGLNLHNRYPLLLPLDAATVMALSGDTRNEAARWIYVLIPIAALLVMRERLSAWFGRTGLWIAAATSWLPALTAVEGGALAAYNDFALMAFAGVALLYLIEAREDARALRVVGLFAAFAVLTKNEGAALAGAIFVAAAAGHRWKSVRLLIPIAIAEAIVVFWRAQVPAAYDEQYEVLASTLPASLDRAPAALFAILQHAASFANWGWFWIGVAVAALVAGRRCAMPIAMMAVALAAYTAALTVTSWQIAELAPVAANRLLAHLLIPAAYVLAAAVSRSGNAIAPRSAVHSRARP